MCNAYSGIFPRFLFGDSAPLFALIGVCLASGTGILTKDDELEGVCWEIRVQYLLTVINVKTLFKFIFLNKIQGGGITFT